MMLIAFALLAAAPPVPAPLSAIEVGCSGGIAGRISTARLAADGRLSRSDRRGQPLALGGRMTAAEARALSDRLDRAGFDTLKTLPGSRTVRDGISCFITRFGAQSHTVQFPAGGPTPRPQDVRRYQEVRAVMSAILAATERVKLNPQPIPPEQRPGRDL